MHYWVIIILYLLHMIEAENKDNQSLESMSEEEDEYRKENIRFPSAAS